MAICEKCKREFEGDSAVCPVCQEQSEKLEDRKLSPKRFILIFCDFAIIAICLLVFLIPTFTDDSRNLSGKFELACYIQNGALYCKNLGDEESEAVVLYEGISGEYGDSTVRDETKYSSDGTVVYFPTNLPDNALSYTLCFYDFKTNGPVKEIAQDVAEYTVSSDGLKVFYLENNSSALYQSDLTQSTKIADDVFEYINSDDGTKVVYADNEANLYLKNGEADVVLVSENGKAEKVTSNFGTVYFTETDENKTAVKKSDFNGNVTCVSEDVFTDMHIYTSGEMYYTEKADAESVSLYYYNGAESQLVAESVAAESIVYAENTAAVVYQAADTNNSKVYHSTGASETIELGKAAKMKNIQLSSKGTHVFFSDTQDGYGRLYEISLADGAEPRLLAKKAGGNSYVAATDNRVLYYKQNGNKNDLYIGEAMVAENIDEAEFSADFASGVIAAYDKNYEKATVSAYINGEVKLIGENIMSYEYDLENGLSVYYTTADGLCKYNSDGTSVLITSGEAQIIL